MLNRQEPSAPGLPSLQLAKKGVCGDSGYSALMINEANTVLALSSTGALWLTVAGVAVVAVLIAAFVVGGRRVARREVSTPAPRRAEAHRALADPARRGEGWSTPDDDPEQGHPHR
ncbi:DUF6479 family protein [Streptomyces sp. NPDC059618]|uniref:DUF6479 family protein n=1 Tax=Streptomyces sp. NPDC059618 TaxID=3346887 RepID=UPI0036B2904A